MRKWEEYRYKKFKTSVFSIEYWLSKGYSPKEAEIKRSEFHKENLNTSSVDFWVKKGLSEEEAFSKVKEIFNKKKVYFANASKDSIKFFSPLMSYLDEINLSYKIGYKDKKELALYDRHNKKCVFYDFAIPSLGIIIEYHGELFHPNPNKLKGNKWDEWRSLTLDGTEGKTANQVKDYDSYKKNLAEKYGYSLWTVWSSENKAKNRVIYKNKVKQIYEDSKQK